MRQSRQDRMRQSIHDRMRQSRQDRVRQSRQDRMRTARQDRMVQSRQDRMGYLYRTEWRFLDCTNNKSLKQDKSDKVRTGKLRQRQNRTD